VMTALERDGPLDQGSGFDEPPCRCAIR